MAVSVSTQSYCPTEHARCTEDKSDYNTNNTSTFSSSFPVHSPFLSIVAPSWEAPLKSEHLGGGSLRVIGLSEIGLDFCGAGSGVTGVFERGSPPEPSLSRTHTCLLGIPLHFQALLCLWPWSLESPRKCIPRPALNDHITLNPLGSMIPLRSWKTILLLLEKAQRPSRLI